MSSQTYEDYWKLTNAFTDYNGKKFLDSLKVCVAFIETHKEEAYSENKYKRLQEEVNKLNPTPLNLASIRKAINQLVKMGFINPYLKSCHPQAKAYLEAKTNKKRKTLLSKIVYSNSSFNSSVKQQSPIKQLNFLIQTLIEQGKLSKKEIIALMLVDIEAQDELFLSSDALQEYVKKAESSGFIKRKYNQVGYLTNLLKKLEDLVFIAGDLYFREDAEQIFGKDLVGESKKRDPYLHRLYKNQLKEESEEIYGEPKCVLERLAYPVLIASHIKPFILSNDNEAYDSNNGLLLSRTIDSLFDLKYISFTDEGAILFSKRVSADVQAFWADYTLEASILNEDRKVYLKYHRRLMSEKDAKI